MKTHIFLSIMTIAVSACGTLAKKAILINAGDDKTAVIRTMGTPADRQFQANLEAWQYCVTGAGHHDYRVIRFREGKVTGITCYKDHTPGTSCVSAFQPIRWEQAPDQTIEIRNR